MHYFFLLPQDCLRPHAVRRRPSTLWLTAFVHDCSGQMLVLGASFLLVVVAVLGLAADVGYLRYTQASLQNAADSAATAAVLELQACGGSTGCAVMQSAAQNALAENGITDAQLVTNCPSTLPNGTVLELNNPPCAQGSADPNANHGAYVEVILTRQMPTYFGKLVGWNTVNVSARSEAQRSGNPYCIVALDNTSANAITVDALASVQTPCGILDESASGFAFTCGLLASVSAPRISVVGNDFKLLCATSPTPQTSVSMPSTADPLAYLTPPTVPPCGASTASPYHGSSTPLLVSKTAVLYADGAYCGGINILPGANVTFMPGTYVLKSNSLGVGGLTIDLGTKVTGSDVTFYNPGPYGGFTLAFTSFLSGGVSLTAPAKGPYTGVLYHQPATNTAPATVIGNTGWNTNLEGALYLPGAAVNYALSGQAAYNILVAKDIHFIASSVGGVNLSSQFSNDYSGLSTGSPAAGTTAVLVE